MRFAFFIFLILALIGICSCSPDPSSSPKFPIPGKKPPVPSDQLKIILSGIYNKESKELIELETQVLLDQDLELKPLLTNREQELEQLDYIKIQLIQNNEPIYEVKHPSDMYISTYNQSNAKKDPSLLFKFVDVIIPIVDEGGFKIRFFNGALWFNNRREVTKKTDEDLNHFHEIDFVWSEGKLKSTN